MNNLHIAISSDSNYIMQSTIFAKSVAESNLKDFNEITIHLLARNISTEDELRFRNEIESFGLKLMIYDLSKIRQMPGIDIPNTISISSYARLFLSSLISKDIDKLIYADTDALNLKSFKDLWLTDLNGYSVAGVLDVVSNKAKTNIGLDCNLPYINAGFLLINLKFWRENQFEQKFIRFLHNHNGNVFHHDQGIINAICNNTIRILPPQYNVVSNFFMKYDEICKTIPFYSIQEIAKGLENAVFIHFTPGIVNRPWVKNCRHPLKNEYLVYKSKTSFRNTDLPYDNRPFRLRLLSTLYFNCKPLYYLLLRVRGLFSAKI